MLNKQEFSNYIREFNFRELFNEMGWNNDRTSQPIAVEEQTFMLQSVAEKSGFKILICSPTSDGFIPDYNTRKKLETKVRKLFQEHLIIFQNSQKTEQIWQLVVRQTGKPTKVTETRWNANQSPELLFQRAAGIFFEIDEEDRITIVDVTKRIAENFHQNAERVTKQFYDRFKKEHGSFYSFLSGIDDHIDEWNRTNPKNKKENLSKQWYVSLMLNRLMFCYFIQKKGFLDKNKNYLRDKLNASQKKNGNQFYSFYRNFLLELFHKGLGEPNHNDGLKAEIGRIPYLNGGLFDEHEIEKDFKDIQIDDKAFERIFDFFDQYEWHLDTRITATGKDINPDVIGYIFEKYINDRAQMGAYYTKEDITEYISKNCVLPFLFDETKRKYPKAFAKDAEIWEMLRTSDDKYIYDAVKHGVNETLPEEIEIGIDTTAANLLERRKGWNKSAPPTYALPTEIWREVVDRRNRYKQAKAKIESGEIENINDFITYNLNIRQFAQDAIENTNDAEFLKAFYQALNSVTIIDPTCGSGAFLFAAMNILEPLYEACLQRMRNFIEDEDRRNAEDKQNFAHKFKYFREVLEDVQSPAHPNLQYFIYKSIILRNLYGVDIMKEAVEIAKLRLFLKLVATVEADYRKPNLGLEPLPDIDFNIRAGNTLIGFANEKDLDNALLSTVEGFIAKPKITEEMEIVKMAYREYKKIQLSQGNNFADFKMAKDDLSYRLYELNKELNVLLHKQTSSLAYKDWHDSHQPFHWFAEFYEIIHDKGGFDVIIGNPPYLELNQIKYTPNHLVTFETSAVHNMCIERSLQILESNGSIAMIVPLALVSTQRMKIVQNLLENNRDAWYSNYAWRPAKLFDTVNRALTIFVASPAKVGKTYANHYQKWNSENRDYLMSACYFVEVPQKRKAFWIPKLGNEVEKTMLEKCLKIPKVVSSFSAKIGEYRIYYRTTGGLYWKVFTSFAPAFNVNGIDGHSSRETSFKVSEKTFVEPMIAALSSNTFWWWYTITSNLRDLNPADIQNFPISESALRDANLIQLGKEYLEDLIANSTMLVREQKQTGTTETQSFKIQKSKPIIDEIDKVLAEHYEFTEEELDFIINYDIKYRMGKELESESDENSAQQSLGFS